MLRFNPFTRTFDIVSSSTGGSSSWGGITGTLSDQTDLQTALDGKVSLSGNETIGGHKYFTSGIYDNSGSDTRSIDTAGRLLTNDQGDPTIEWQGMLMKDSIGVTALRWEDRQLLDDSGDIAMDWTTGVVRLRNTANGEVGILDTSLITAGRTYTLPDKDGILALLSFETVSKNLDASDATLNYTGDNLTSIDYANGITKTLDYTGDNLTSVILSGSTPGGISLTKLLDYTGENITGISYA